MQMIIRKLKRKAVKGKLGRLRKRIVVRKRLKPGVKLKLRKNKGKVIRLRKRKRRLRSVKRPISHGPAYNKGFDLAYNEGFTAGYTEGLAFTG